MAAPENGLPERDLSTLSHEELEAEADKLLEATLKDRRRNKSRTAEYPILSPRQLQRRVQDELPFSSLRMGLRLKYSIPMSEE